MRRLLIVQLAFGIFVLFWGAFAIPVMMPHVLLDVVLTPEELQDQKKVDETLELLKKVNGRSNGTIATGLFIVTTSVIGLRLNRVNHQLRSLS
jgi:hypothetical protein